MENLKIDIKYFPNKEGICVPDIRVISCGDWIDLRASQSYAIKKGDFELIKLGVGMKLPEGYEAIIAPRSSTFKKYGIIQTNSIGIIDNSYSGDNDEWMLPVIAMRDTVIPIHDRICQFRIIKNQPEVQFNKVEKLNDEDRGGFGSTGTK